MPRRGYMKAWRKAFDPTHWLAPTKAAPASRLHAWLDICQQATHQDIQHRDTDLKRGQVVLSVRHLGERWRWSKSRVSRFIRELEARTAIETVGGTPYGTVYLVVNYDLYAGELDGERDTKRDTKWDTSGTPAGQEQEQKHLRSKITTSSERPRYSPEFSEVWSIHPRGSKAKANEQYALAVGSRITHDDLKRYLSSYVNSEINERFHGHDLFRWIRDDRWEEYVARASKNGNGNGVPLEGGGFYVGG